MVKKTETKKPSKTKPKAKAKPKVKKKVDKKEEKRRAIARMGRPPIEYNPDYHPAQAYKYALLGSTIPEMANLFGISHDTLELWMDKYPDFSVSIENGGVKADAEVASRLHQRAMGYVKTVEQAFKVKKGKDVEVVEVVTLKQEEAPDTKAATLWLSNRQRGKWKDRQTQEHDVSDDLAEILRKGRERHNAFLAELEEEKKRRGDI